MLPHRYMLSFVFKLAGLLILLEITFRFVLPASEMPYYAFHRETNVLNYDLNKQRDGLYTFGSFAEIQERWHVNNMGWISNHDYQSNGAKPVIAVIGNSYVEAFQVDPERTVARDLQRKVGDGYAVYSFGVSGSHLSQYLQISRYVRNTFHPQVMIFNIVDDDIPGSLFAQGNKPGNTYFIAGPSSVSEVVLPYTPSKGEFYRKSALLRYARLNSGFWGSGKVDTASVPVVKHDSPYSAALTEYAFSTIRQENPDTRVVIVLDAPRQTIYRGLPLDKDRQIRMIVSTASSRNGFHLVDLTEPMARLYEKNHQRFDFINNGHWNEYGHQVVSDQIYEKLVKSRILAGS